ncbi:WD40/YVTN/BNR-like repeat-containing protein [Streptomyces violascens]|uniref:WD40/YVTN/BNR-like repeat-containing protein n=1 Tax=Streptomyces violascens TaxID=67381 RepID=UPI00365B7D8A
MRSKGKTRRMLSVGLGGVALAAALTVPAQAHGHGTPAWQLKDTKTDARFRGLAAVSRSTAWVAGTKGTVLRTSDGGRSWQNVSPAGAAGLEFRDVEAFDGRRAVVLAIGEGEASRVYRTEDGGASWSESFRNTDPKAFYDCLTFLDPRHGLAVSDPVDGKYRILSTADGGRSWNVLPNTGMPAALPGEAGFAASGQCLVSSGPRDVWLAALVGGVDADVGDLERGAAVADDPAHPDRLPVRVKHHAVPGVGQRQGDRLGRSVGQARDGTQMAEGLGGGHALPNFVIVDRIIHALHAKRRELGFASAGPVEGRGLGWLP